MSEEDKLHLEEIRKIVKEEIECVTKGINRNLNWFFTVAVAFFLAVFGFQISISRDVQGKSDSKEVERDYIKKLEYYQIEADEHRMIIEAFTYPDKASYVFDKINDNIASSLGFKYTTRGSQNK